MSGVTMSWVSFTPRRGPPNAANAVWFGCACLPSAPGHQGVGVRYAYAVTVSVRRSLPPYVGPGERLLGLGRWRTSSPSTSSTKDLHVAFTVLSEGVGVSPGPPGFGAEGGTEKGGGDGEVRGRDWGRVATTEVEVERQSG